MEYFWARVTSSSEAMYDSAAVRLVERFYVIQQNKVATDENHKRQLL